MSVELQRSIDISGTNLTQNQGNKSMANEDNKVERWEEEKLLKRVEE